MSRDECVLAKEERSVYGIGHTDLVIVVLSCDKYSDLWAPFFYCFQRYWSECPFPLYLFANEKIFEGATGVTTILSGPDRDWSSSIKACLEQIKHEYVLVLFDDVFLCKPVRPDNLAPLLNWLGRNKPAYLRFRPVPHPDERVSKNIGRYRESTLYRTAVFAIWRRDVLLDILKPGESAWELEIDGARRSVRYPDFYGCYNNVLAYAHGIEKGKWFPAVARWLGEIGAPISTSARQVMTHRDVVMSQFGHFREAIFNHSPAGVRPHLVRASRVARKMLGR
jgi:hypothetical protein